LARPSAPQPYALSLHDALPIFYPQDISIGDVNQDGWLDVFFAQASGGVDFLYLGSAEGFRPNRRIAIPGQGHRSSAITDLDGDGDRKSTRLNSSHVKISYAVFC